MKTSASWHPDEGTSNSHSPWRREGGLTPGDGKWSRRDFLKTASAATLGALAAGYPRALFANDAEAKINPTADTLIVLWMAGGMAHTETFDPKQYKPFEPGIKPGDVGSTFPAIDTAVDHIKFTAGLEKIAGVMDRGTLIRGHP